MPKLLTEKSNKSFTDWAGNLAKENFRDLSRQSSKSIKVLTRVASISIKDLSKLSCNSFGRSSTRFPDPIISSNCNTRVKRKRQMSVG